MSHIVFFYPNSEGGQKKIILQLTEYLKKEKTNCLISSLASCQIQIVGYFGLLRSILLNINLCKKQYQKDKKNSFYICSSYFQTIALLLHDPFQKYFYYLNNLDRFKNTDLYKKYKQKNIKKYYAILINKFEFILQKISYLKAKIIVVPNSYAKKSLIKIYQIPKEKIKVIANGINTKQFCPITKKEKYALRKQLGWKKKDKIITYMGRIHPRKGIKELVISFNQLQKQNNNLNLQIIYPKTGKGEKSYSSQIEKKSNKNIIFIENPQKIEQYYQISDLVVLPSKEEIMPLAMLESLACGIPFIGSKAGNMPEVLSLIDKNLVLSKTNPKTISEKINWLLNLPGKKLEKIRKKSTIVGRYYSLNKTVRQFSLLLR